MRAWARKLKDHIVALYLAARHPGTPWYARTAALLVVAYAASPIDLIPDPIPVLGYLDDLVIVPLGIWLTLKLIPDAVWNECLAQAEAGVDIPRAVRIIGAVAIVAVWAGLIYWLARLILA